MKASICERWNRSLKGWMWREFTVQGSYKWLDLVPKLVEKYNNKVHRTIGMKPKNVRKKHEKLILKRLKTKEIASKTPKFKVNDLVRVSKFKNVFSKGYTPTWSNEKFKIVLVNRTKPVTYIIKDSKHNIIKGGFYEEELSKTKTGDVYLIEKVLKKQKNKVLVRYLGFDKSHDEWIDKNQLV